MSEHHYPPGLARRHDCRQRGKLTCGGAFRCSACRRLVGWCMGGDFDAADPTGTKCSECWHDTFRKFPVRVVPRRGGSWLVIRRLPAWVERLADRALVHPATDELEARKRTRAEALRHARKVSTHVITQ